MEKIFESFTDFLLIKESKVERFTKGSAMKPEITYEAKTVRGVEYKTIINNLMYETYVDSDIKNYANGGIRTRSYNFDIDEDGDIDVNHKTIKMVKFTEMSNPKSSDVLKQHESIIKSL